MESGLKKKPFQCPKCDFVQLEPPHLISTYCRACGEYYEVGRAAAKPVLPAAPVPVEVARRVSIFCHRCGASHPVSKHAESTICPSCNAGIELVDLEFLNPVARPIDTRGHLRLGPGANLTSSWIICGSARIEGRVSGPFRSEGEVQIATKHLLHCEIVAPSVTVEKHACTSLSGTLETDALTVRGSLAATVRCRGTIRVLRGGVLQGHVFARGIIVEKGGTLTGDCRVDVTQPYGLEAASPLTRPKRNFGPILHLAVNPGLAG